MEAAFTIGGLSTGKESVAAGIPVLGLDLVEGKSAAGLAGVVHRAAT
jgi:hypothetical protein